MKDKKTAIFARASGCLNLIIGVILGVLGTFGSLTINEFSEGMFQITQTYESSSEALELIRSRGVDAPSDAYDLEYLYVAGRDWSCWLAFSAPHKKMQPILDKYAALAKEDGVQHSFLKPSYQ